MKPSRFIIMDVLNKHDLGNVLYTMQDDGSATVYDCGQETISAMNNAMQNEGLTCRFYLAESSSRINITNKFLTFEGSVSEASDLVAELHEAYRTAGMDMSKTLHDFVFALEVQCIAQEADLEEETTARFLENGFPRVEN